MLLTVQLLERTLEGSSPIDAEILADGQRAFVEGTHPVIIAHSGSDRLVLRYEYLLRYDDVNDDVEIEKSTFKIEFRARKKPVPVVRFEYESQARNKPASHFQFHADSVPLGLLLARAGRYAPQPSSRTSISRWADLNSVCNSRMSSNCLSESSVLRPRQDGKSGSIFTAPSTTTRRWIG